MRNKKSELINALRKPLSLSLMLLFFLALFVRFLIGTEPLLVVYKSQIYFPVVEDIYSRTSPLAQDLLNVQKDFSKLEYSTVLWPLFYKSVEDIDLERAHLSPMSSSGGSFFLLGTDELGRDMLGACFYGLQSSLWICCMALIIGLLLGFIPSSMVSYHAYKMRTISQAGLWFGIILLAVTMWILMVISQLNLMNWKLWSLFLIGFILSMFILWRLNGIGKKVSFSFDFITLLYINIFKAIPSIIFVLLLIQTYQTNQPIGISFVLAILTAPVIAKYSRASVIKHSADADLDSAQSLGLTHFDILRRHLWPRVFLDLVPLLSYLMSSLIITESSLAYLGIGLNPEQISLGSLISSSRNYPADWWATLFPGLIIFWISLSFYLLGWSRTKRSFEEIA